MLMKRIIVFLVVINVCLSAFAERIYKSFVINGEIINKWVDSSYEIYEYDSNDRVVFSEKDGWIKRDYKYDSKGTLIDSDYDYQYGPDGQLLKKIHKKERNSITYDSFGNEVFIDHPNYQHTKDYDDKGVLMHEELIMNSNHNRDEERWYDNDQKGHCVHMKNSKGFEEWYTYDSNGNQVHAKDSNGLEIFSTYNKTNKVIYMKKIDEGKVYECWYDYDPNGNLIHSRDSNKSELWTEYEYNDRKLIVKKTTYKSI